MPNPNSAPKQPQAKPNRTRQQKHYRQHPCAHRKRLRSARRLPPCAFGFRCRRALTFQSFGVTRRRLAFACVGLCGLRRRPLGIAACFGFDRAATASGFVLRVDLPRHNRLLLDLPSALERRALTGR